jgi:hypothetical protein
MTFRVSFPQIAGISGLALALLSLSCGISRGPANRHRAERVLYGWHDDGGPGKVNVRISLPDQIAEIKRGDREIGWCYVATGKEGHNTSPGTYKITEKIEDKYSNIYGWIEDDFGNVVDGDAKARDRVPEGMVYVPAPMPYWMRLTSYGVGMHGGIIPQPGEPASHGCIRLPKEFVPTVFDVVDVGTPVVITNEPSNHGFQNFGNSATDAPLYGDRPGGSGDHQWTPGGLRVDSGWTPGGNGGQSAEWGTYRNGLPVSYR